MIKKLAEEQLKFLKEATPEELEKTYRPLAEAVASHYEGEGLAEIALSHLEKVKKIFLKHEKSHKFKFSTYLSWFFKRAIEIHLGIPEEPLKN